MYVPSIDKRPAGSRVTDPTPASPEKVINGAAGSKTPQHASPRPHPQVLVAAPIRNEPTYKVNVNAEVQPTNIGTPRKAILSPSVVIPGLPSPSQRAEYEVFLETDERLAGDADDPSQKRKRDGLVADHQALVISSDQQEKANAASRNLESLLLEVFEAEDQLQSDTSGAAVSTDVLKYFTSSSASGRGVPILAPAVQTRLDSVIQKVVALGRFHSIQAEQLGRVQKLCESAVSCVDSTSLSVGDGWADSDLEEWAHRIGLAENGLQAAKTLLRIMTAGREEKQLYSEDVLQSILSALRHVVDMCLVPVVEARSTGPESDIFRACSNQKNSLSALLQTSSRTLRMLGDLIIKVDVAEEAITAVEFLCTRLIFVENAHSEKESALGVQRFETVRRIAMDVLAKVFAGHADQRPFIFDEILTSLEKLPVTRQSARQFKLIDGKPIQLVSALLMRLIQTSATRSTKVKRRQIIHDDAAADDQSGSEHDSTSPRKTLRAAATDMTSKLDGGSLTQEVDDLSKPLHESAQNSAHYLVKFMVQRALTATKTGDQPYRNLLDIFTEDFISVLGSTDWPAAEMLLRALLSNMVGLMESDKSGAPAKNMALDLMGLMGSSISDLQIYARQASQNLDASETELSMRLVQITEDVMEDKQTTDMLVFDGPYRVIIEYLETRDSNDPQLQSARGYYLTQWTRGAIAALAEESDTEDDRSARELMENLHNMTMDPRWLEAEW